MSAASPSAPFPKILVCTDGSPDSEGAISAALNLAKTTGSTIFLLEVLFYLAGYELQAPDTLAPPIVNMELMQAQETAVRERLEARKAEAAGEGVVLTPRVRTGSSAYEGILEEVGESQPDLIIMGRHGYTGLTRLLMGSVTARVIGHSPCDVLVVPREVPLSFKRLLVASDGSPFSEAAWTKALLLAKTMGSALIGVSVAVSDRDIPVATKVVRGLEAAASQQGIALDTMIPMGRPEEGIVKAAEFKGASLIIVGSHGRTGLKRLLMGSVAERVIGDAKCPVLVVKKK
ncbi:MAG: universal stress protein [Desulfobacterales bacterium]|nr:universal stress protein [Pseudomonadota bacterium]MBU4355830.1 universal stress protein [Pseudomonadota bacterium]MCG2773789.1 universal stress protein [Desulfobacterales bacterium]